MFSRSRNGDNMGFKTAARLFLVAAFAVWVCEAKLRLPPIELVDDEGPPHKYMYKNDALIAPKSRTPFRGGKLRGSDLVVDCLVLLDYGIFQRFSKNFQDVPEGAERTAAVTQYLKEYYGLTFAAVAQRYEEADLKIDGKDGRIRLRLAALHMATTPEEDEWSQPYVEPLGSTRFKIMDVDVLNGAANWFKKEKKNGKFLNVDHVMLFTGHDIWHYGNDWETGEVGVPVGYAVGVSFKGQVCDKLTVSATEEDMQFKSVSTAAHELGHNLGADHDGEGEGASCPAKDDFLMNGGVTKGDNENMYKFSPCSKNSFRIVMEKLNSKGANCLADTKDQAPEMKKLSDVIPGFIFDLHQQCKIFMRNKDSFYCGGNTDKDLKNICVKPKCWNPRGKFCGDFIGQNHVLPGTPCGTDKWCRNGKCVPAKREIPLTKNGCVYEDQPKCEDYHVGNCRIWGDSCCNKCGEILGK